MENRPHVCSSMLVPRYGRIWILISDLWGTNLINIENQPYVWGMLVSLDGSNLNSAFESYYTLVSNVNSNLRGCLVIYYIPFSGECNCYLPLVLFSHCLSIEFKQRIFLTKMPFRHKIYIPNAPSLVTVNIQKIYYFLTFLQNIGAQTEENWECVLKPFWLAGLPLEGVVKYDKASICLSRGKIPEINFKKILFQEINYLCFQFLLSLNFLFLITIRQAFFWIEVKIQK